jgi:riboflavin biosynthesis pyrimidine reductase
MNHIGPEQFPNQLLPPMDEEEVKQWVYNTVDADNPLLAMRQQEEDQARRFVRVVFGATTTDELKNVQLTVEEADHVLDVMGRTYAILSPTPESKNRANLDGYAVSRKLPGANNDSSRT